MGKSYPTQYTKCIINYISNLIPPNILKRRGKGKRCREEGGKRSEVWADQPRKNYKITQIKVEFMQTYEVNAFLRSCGDCLMLK